MTKAKILHLRAPGSIDPREVLTGPLRRISRHHLRPGEELALSADGAEFTVFVLAGAGTASSGQVQAPLAHGVSVTLPLGDAVTLTAGDAELQIFVAELTVPEPVRP